MLSPDYAGDCRCANPLLDQLTEDPYPVAWWQSRVQVVADHNNHREDLLQGYELAANASAVVVGTALRLVGDLQGARALARDLGEHNPVSMPRAK